MQITILGIRHHGAGSAKNVVAMLQKIKPDLILVEGPPEMDAITQWVGKKELRPPVAALCYDEAKPERAVFYPFAEFSPEWQALSYAHNHKVPVRMMDLPLAISWEMADKRAKEAQAQAEEAQPNPPPAHHDSEERFLDDTDAKIVHKAPADFQAHREPLSYFAEISGYSDTDLWWEHHFEQSKDGPEEHFEAVMLTMQTLREQGIASALDEENIYREAYMGQLIRKARNEMYSNIVVVCGAWHAPALLDLDKTEKEHTKIVEKLPKTKIKVAPTWIPWTNNRLSQRSGYGAGIQSPGWYGHLWKNQKDGPERWLSKVAMLFRKKKMDISTAHVIESVRLAESLASLRGRTQAGLNELNEATQTVMCMGDGILLELVKNELIIGHAIGKVPDDMPKLPLQSDFEEQSKKLNLPQTAEPKDIKLDLRTEFDLKKSVFLHQTNILGIKWGKITSTRSKGTFREIWTIYWKPEIMVSIIEQGIWGNTVMEAATKYLLDRAARSESIGELSGMIGEAIPAELFGAMGPILQKIDNLATVSADIAELMAALVPLADLGIYGNVRNTDTTAINKLVEGMLTRVCIGLPNACYGLDEAAGLLFFDHIKGVNDAVRLLEKNDLQASWYKTLEILLEKQGIPPIINGCTCRLLFDAKRLEGDMAAQKFSFALSAGQAPAYAAGWVEGFLKGSGMILLLDDVLWNLLYQWVANLQPDAFVDMLPILRRTFSRFPTVERRKLGEKAAKGTVLNANSIGVEEDVDEALGEMVLPLVSAMLR